MTSLLLESVPGFLGGWAFPGLMGGSMTAVISLLVLMKIETGAVFSLRWKW